MINWQRIPADCSNYDTLQPPEEYLKEMRVRFSIILCTYNRCNMVLSTLASLRRQTLPFPYFEVIVVDNGSSDDSLQKIRAYVNAGTIHNRAPEDTWQVRCLAEPRNGLAYARNKGVQLARGDIAVFLDDDTLAIPCFLTNLLNAYEATGADAIGGRVELHWEAARPHWLTDDLLPMSGHFAPSTIRMPLLETQSFSASNFSVKMEVLHTIGPFLPFLSKRLHIPIRVESLEFCQRLHTAGYALWYDPDVVVAHRVPAARLQRAFFLGRAYWQGRSEAMLDYVNGEQDGRPRSLVRVLYTLFYELSELLQIALVHRPLLYFADRPAYERLQAALTQTAIWGHLWQQIQFIEHAPALLTTPAVLFVGPDEHDAFPLLQELLAQDLRCTVTSAVIPLSWLWRHRTYRAQPVGIVHIHQAGAFNLNHLQRQSFWLRLRLAQCLGIRIVTTDTGGWWYNVRSLPFLARRVFERQLLSCSDIVLTYSRQITQLYPDKRLRRRVRFITHPGYRGYYPLPIAREQAYKQLGLPHKATFVYLCFAHAHTERELLQLVAAFAEAGEQQKRKKSISSRKRLQLLLVGSPRDKKFAQQLLKQAAFNSAVHLFMGFCDKDLPLYMGAANVLVMPHFALPSVGILETALLALSYTLIVVAPDLPRFQGVLPSHGSILYDATRRSSLVQALVKAQSPRYHLREKDQLALDAARGWQSHAKHLLEIYRQLLEQT